MGSSGGNRSLAVFVNLLNLLNPRLLSENIVIVMGDRPDRSTQTAAPDDRRITGTVLPPFSSLVRIDVSALSHAGHLRENNEDQFFVTKMSRALETMLTSLPRGDVPERVEEVNYMLIVADGMGGHAAGELASRPRSARSSASRWTSLTG